MHVMPITCISCSTIHPKDTRFHSKSFSHAIGIADDDRTLIDELVRLEESNNYTGPSVMRLKSSQISQLGR